MIITQPDSLALGAATTVLITVPLFHANGWGLAFAGACVRAVDCWRWCLTHARVCLPRASDVHASCCRALLQQHRPQRKMG